MTTHETHAYERVAERLAEAGLSQDSIEKFFQVAKALAAQSTVGSEAMRLLDLGRMVGQAWGDRSNGSQVWAIVRGRELRTVMLRRATQPSTPQAFNVDKVTVVA